METSSISLNNQTELTSTTSTPTSKNAYSRIFCNLPLLAANFFYILPDQSLKTTTSSTKYASVPTVSNDNPVGNWDPSGEFYRVFNKMYPGWKYLKVVGNISNVVIDVQDNFQPLYSGMTDGGMDIQFCQDGPYSEAVPGMCQPNSWIPDQAYSMFNIRPNWTAKESGFNSSELLYYFNGNRGNGEHFGNYSNEIFGSSQSGYPVQGPPDDDGCPLVDYGGEGEDAAYQMNNSNQRLSNTECNSIFSLVSSTHLGAIAASEISYDYFGSLSYTLVVSGPGNATVSVSSSAT